MALTATATERVQKDIMRFLQVLRRRTCDVASLVRGRVPIAVSLAFLVLL